MALPEEGRWWFRQAIDALGEELPHPDAVEAVKIAFVDRVLAHAEATGAVERVTYRTSGPMIVEAPDGKRWRVLPGEPIVTLDKAGRAYLLCVAEP